MTTGALDDIGAIGAIITPSMIDITDTVRPAA